MTVLEELKKLQDDAGQAPESAYKRGYLDALDEAIEIAEAEED